MVKKPKGRWGTNRGVPAVLVVDMRNPFRGHSLGEFKTSCTEPGRGIENLEEFDVKTHVPQGI